MSTFLRLVDYKSSMEKEAAFIEKKSMYCCSEKIFYNAPKKAFLYWLKNREVFNFEKMSNDYESGGRNKTHNNEKYVRKWWEVADLERWQTYENGGDYRKWYGNCLDVVDWSDEAKSNYKLHGGLYNQKFANKFAISWNLISSSKVCFRIKTKETHYSSGSPTIFSKKEKITALGFLNSVVARFLLNMLNPTMNTTVKDVLVLPVNYGFQKEQIDSYSRDAIKKSKSEWDDFEISKDFKRHPLL